MPEIRVQDIADILILTALVYLLYSWFKRSRAIQVMAGLGIIMAIFFLTRHAGLHMTSWLLQQLETVIIVLIVVVFQGEIRQALYRFNLLRGIIGGEGQEGCGSLSILSTAVFELADERCGAIIVFQRGENIDDHLMNGVAVDSLVSGHLLKTLFVDGTPLHDGAVLIRGERIALASCHLPLSDSAELPQNYGTRHRAALGLSERTDAVVVVVSEERGEVSLAVGHRIETVSSAEVLEKRLAELLVTSAEQAKDSFVKTLFSDLVPKAAIFSGVTIIWLLLSTRQGEVATATVPLLFQGLPEGMAIVRSNPDEVTVRLRSNSGLAPSPRHLDLAADVNLSGVSEGQNALRITPNNIRVPGGVTVVGVEPGVVRVTVRPATKR
jgi:diadenylate cyclase